MVSFPWEEGPEWYIYAFGIGYYVRHVEFGTTDEDVFHIFSKEGRTCGSVYLGEIRITQDMGLPTMMQKLLKVRKLFFQSDMPLRKSWWD